MAQRDRKFSRPQRFIHAPPLKGTRTSKRAPIEPPFPDAPPWKCSVYYLWWEYLRCHDGYRETCLAGGQGKYAKLYSDFGDVHAEEFWDWWQANGVRLFAEPPPELVTELHAGTYVRKRADAVVMSIPLDMPMRIVSRQIKRQIASRQAAHRAARVAQGAVSQARYPVAARANLPALYKNLQAWQARQADPDMKLYELHAKLLGITDRVKLNDAANRIDWTNEMARRIRKARELIINVGLGFFPLIGLPRTGTKDQGKGR